MPFAPSLRRVVPLLLCAAAAQCYSLAQDPLADPPTASSNSTGQNEIPQVPGFSGVLRGVNAGLTISAVHDSQTGWATLAQPAVGYSFNDVFALDITVPIYIYRLAGNTTPNPPPDQRLIPQHWEPGDVIFSLHAQFLPRGFQYQATVSATAPTGDTEYALSTGRATFDLTNQFQHNFKYATPNIEIGVGDSSTLVNPLVTRDYTSLGPLAHFQAGFAFPLRRGLSFETSAYEQLPIGDQKIYQTVPRRGGGPSVTVVTGRSVSEDNGFTNTLDVPIGGHITFSAYYSRSLRLKDDVVAVGFTYVLRTSKSAKDKISDDDLLRGIEQELQHDPAKASTAQRP